jgi:hypothetical protein
MRAMFGFSLPKLIFTAAIVAAVIYGFRLIGRKTGGGSGSNNAPSTPQAEDTQKCAVCGTYVSANNPAVCERDDCPYPA